MGRPPEKRMRMICGLGYFENEGASRGRQRPEQGTKMSGCRYFGRRLVGRGYDPGRKDGFEPRCWLFAWAEPSRRDERWDDRGREHGWRGSNEPNPIRSDQPGTRAAVKRVWPANWELGTGIGALLGLYIYYIAGLVTVAQMHCSRWIE